MIEVHVEGRIETGRLSAFMTGVEHYREYLCKHDYVAPRVFHAISGPMNTIRLVYVYPDLNAYQRHEENSAADPAYAEAASGMPFADGTISYTIYRPLDE